MSANLGYKHLGISFAVAALLAACSSISGTSNGVGLTPAGQETSAPAPADAPQTRGAHHARRKKERGKARVHIVIPAHKWKIAVTQLAMYAGKRNRRHPHYISASTKSMTLAVAGSDVPVQTFDLTPSSTGCTTVAGGSVSCSVTAFFPVGNQTLTITLFDQTGGQGNALSTATDPVTIAPGAVTNVSVTLDGVPSTASVQLNGSSSASVPAGTPTSLPMTVTALDADGNLIMTPGDYSTPITLSDSDTSGATTLSSTTVTTPGESLSLAYNGSAIASATITPSVNGTQQPHGAATLTLASTPTPSPSPTPTPTATPLANALFVWSGAKLQFFDESGDILTTSGFAGFAAATPPGGMAYDPNNGFIYMTYRGAGTGACTLTTGCVEAFNTAGVQQTLTGAFAGANDPWGVAFDSHNDQLYVVDGTSGSPTVHVYDEQGNPVSVSGAWSDLNGPQGIVFDPSNDELYVSNTTGNTVTAYDENGVEQTLSGGFPNLSSPFGMAYDPNNGFIYVANAVAGKLITVYDQDGTQQTVSGTWANVKTPSAVVFDSNTGNLYVTNEAGGTPPALTGSVTLYDANGDQQAPTSGKFVTTYNKPTQLLFVP